MKTLVYKISVSDEDARTIESLQHDWSVSFRRLYNNFDLVRDKGFASSLRIQSAKQYDYLRQEVEAFKKREDKIRANKIKLISALESSLALSSREVRKLDDLRKSLSRKVVFGGRKNLQDRTKGVISKEEWRESRLLPLVFYGETNRFGNRFFDLRNINNGEILFKLEGSKIRIPISINANKHKRDLEAITHYCSLKQIPVTIKLSHNRIWISYDETCLSGSLTSSKDFIRYEGEVRSKRLDRYLAIDSNPNCLGYCIVDRDLNILYKGALELDSGISQDKRRYEIAHCVKFLFGLVKSYRVSYVVIEDLSGIDRGSYGNRASNRKNKLEWCRNLIYDLVRRRCNESQTVLREVKAYYSSFIGNLIYNEYDPIASSIELARRGINKYKKSCAILPVFSREKILTDKIDRNFNLESYESWQDLYRAIRDKSYRRKGKTFLSQVYSWKSHISLYI